MRWTLDRDWSWRQLLYVGLVALFAWEFHEGVPPRITWAVGALALALVYDDRRRVREKRARTHMLEDIAERKARRRAREEEGIEDHHA